MWTREDIAAAKVRACEHAILSTFPQEGSPTYRGFEVCPFCGTFAPMMVKFREETLAAPEERQDASDITGTLVRMR